MFVFRPANNPTKTSFLERCRNNNNKRPHSRISSNKPPEAFVLNLLVVLCGNERKDLEKCATTLYFTFAAQIKNIPDHFKSTATYAIFSKNAQEFFNNAIDAGATRIQIKFEERNKDVLCSIIDNGFGIQFGRIKPNQPLSYQMILKDRKKIPSTKINQLGGQGLALAQVMHQLEPIKGTLSFVRTQTFSGTKIILCAPKDAVVPKDFPPKVSEETASTAAIFARIPAKPLPPVQPVSKMEVLQVENDVTEQVPERDVIEELEEIFQSCGDTFPDLLSSLKHEQQYIQKSRRINFIDIRHYYSDDKLKMEYDFGKNNVNYYTRDGKHAFHVAYDASTGAVRGLGSCCPDKFSADTWKKISSGNFFAKKAATASATAVSNKDTDQTRTCGNSL